MLHLDDLIASGVKLMSERDDLKADRDAEKARADKAEADAAELRAQIAADEGKASTALTAMQAEVDAEAPAAQRAPVVVTVSAPTTAPAAVIPVDDTTGIVEGSTVSGPGVSNATVSAVDHDTSTITLDSPTTTDHVGDGSEALSITPAAAS